MTTTQTATQTELLDAMRAAGWEAVEDQNGEVTPLDDIADADCDKSDRQEYLIEADIVTLMRDGYRQEVVYYRRNLV
jgi:hypothetical protein